MPICHKYREPAAIYKVDRVIERGNQLEGAVLKIVICPKKKTHCSNTPHWECSEQDVAIVWTSYAEIPA